MKSLILLGDNVQDVEAAYCYYRLKEEGEVCALALNWPVKGVNGLNFGKIIPEGVKDSRLDMWKNFDAIVLVGGVIYLERARQDKGFVRLVRDFYDNGKVIASLCHGAQMMIEADIVRGHEVLGYYSIRRDIENAGGVWPEGKSVAVSGNIVSAPHYNFMSEWMVEVIKKCRP